ncbi:MAG: hypothetical protein GF315_06215 [candidate division Zixibacteria bacterium]|nr:hypothetical protein [candidate division Zixibacteria bacterium]
MHNSAFHRLFRVSGLHWSNFRRLLSIAIIFVLLSLSINASAITLNILHVNDTHSHIEENNNGEFGFARMKTVVDSYKNRDGEHTLFIHCGDMFPGSLYYNIYHGRSDIRAFNMMDLDILILGNHEFDAGPDSLAAILPLTEAEVLSANIENIPPNLRKFVKPHTVIEYDNLKVGVIGLTTVHTEDISITEGIKFVDYLKTVKESVKDLKREECDYIILATHIGEWGCAGIISNTSGIDLALDGHSHQFEDKFLPNMDGMMVRYRQARHHGEYVGAVTLNFSEKGKLTEPLPVYEMIKLDSSIPQDPEFMDSLEVWSEPIKDYAGTIVGYISADLPDEYPATRQREVALCNLIADAFLWYGKKYGASAAIINGGGVRAAIHAPDVKFREIYETLPFENTLDMVALTGEQLMDALNNGVSKVGTGSGTGRFPHVAGIRYAYDKETRRITSAKILDGGEYTDINPQKEYKVAVNSYMAGGGDGYLMLAELKPSDKMSDLATQQEVLAEYLRKISSKGNPLPVEKLVDGRIEVLGK